MEILVDGQQNGRVSFLYCSFSFLRGQLTIWFVQLFSFFLFSPFFFFSFDKDKLATNAKIDFYSATVRISGGREDNVDATDLTFLPAL